MIYFLRTEGGETPFVIGACNRAAVTSSRAPYFLYCNPDEVLMPIHRSREVIENKKIKKINLTVGPMAISGSTRMQSSTVLMLGIGVELLYRHSSQEGFLEFYLDFLHRLTLTHYETMAPFTELEAKLYKEKKYLNYVTDPYLGVSILTDTTERSPTFSLRGFENRLGRHRVFNIQMDDLITKENSKLKPLSVSIAVDEDRRTILAMEVSQIPAFGHLATLSRKKYGDRIDQHSDDLMRLFQKIAPIVSPEVSIKSDEHQRYPRFISIYLPRSRHTTFKNELSCVAGQGELKKCSLIRSLL